ncbi:MAG: uroporphyrinogen-III C-methyltransferase, partial [Pseudomonadota bacterium]
RAAGVLVNTVDTLEACDFITPAMVDRTPVTVAIGTEGAAPVLARRIKAQVEENLTPDLGLLARAGQAFRKDAMRLPFGQPRRAFWSEYYDTTGPKALAGGGPDALPGALASLLQRHLAARPSEGHVDFVGAGPGDPELLTRSGRCGPL